MKQIIKSRNIINDLSKVLESYHHDNLFVLTDENTNKNCYPLIADINKIRESKKLVIPANDSNKNIENLTHVWKFLTNHGATRHSMLINLGGGMVTDLGGFVAATFKRGIDYINIPTTVLGSVDAAVGGKTGINFEGYKNEIGAFYPAKHVIISSEFLKTLDIDNIQSGYAEMVKHALLDTVEKWNRVVHFDLSVIHYEVLNDLVLESVLVKQNIVEKDPYEKNIRKALNLGHTIGHALESLALYKNNPILHGYAIAWGLVAEIYISTRTCNFPKNIFEQLNTFVRQNYSPLFINHNDYDRLYSYMIHDKKNVGENINFTLLADIGNIRIDQNVEKATIDDAFNFIASR